MPKKKKKQSMKQTTSQMESTFSADQFSADQSVDEMILNEMLEQSFQKSNETQQTEGSLQNKKNTQENQRKERPLGENVPPKVVSSSGTGSPKDSTSLLLSKRKKKVPVGKVIVAIVLIAVVALIVRSCFFSAKQGEKVEYEEVKAERRDLTVVLNGTGSITGADEAVIIPAMVGKVQSVDCQEGDMVKKDQVLITLDRADGEYAVERAQLALDSANDTYQQLLETQNDQNITATAAGVIDTLSIEEGDSITAGMVVATISDRSSMLLKLPFFSADCDQISVGASATVTVNGTFETIAGTVDSISALPTVGPGGTVVREVTIRVNNPGNLTNETYATAVVDGIACSGSGVFSYQTEKSVVSKSIGEVSKVSVQEGSVVQKGQVIAVLSSEDIENQIQSAKRAVEDAALTLENAQHQLDNYTIKSPISGVVVEQNCAAGDTLVAGTPIMTLYDLSYLTFEIQVDELDISMVEVGQTVEVTADALPNDTFQGVVDKIGMKGETALGVTTYPVTVRLEGNIDGLMPGMNVDANISIGTYENVLTVPVEAVTRGNTVLVSEESPSAKGSEGDETKETEEIDGFVRVPIELGAADDYYIIVTSGLQEGDTLAVVNQESGNLFDRMMTGGMNGQNNSVDNDSEAGNSDGESDGQ